MSQDDKDYDVLLSNVRAFAKSQGGRDVIWAILEFCNIYSSIPGKFESGKRDVGLNVIQLLEDAEPKLYAQLLLEKQL